jgi:NAD(P)H dehydrogenase (quinone)
MANAVAEGAREVEGVVHDVKRVPETVPREIAEGAHFKLDQAAPIATLDDLRNYDAIIVGAPTRYGRMASQMTAFWDAAGPLWASGALSGKVGSAFSSTATQHGGQEMTLFAIITNLLHFGLHIVGLPYDWAGQQRLDEITGGAPYGITTISGSDGSRLPTENELDGARFQGRRVADVATRLFPAKPADAPGWERRPAYV